MLVAGDRMVFRDEELCRAQRDESDEARGRNVPPDTLHQGERRPGEAGSRGCQRDESGERCPREILLPQEVVEDVKPVRRIGKARVLKDEKRRKRGRA
jgi:hypothetical protein